MGADARPLAGHWVPDFAVTNASGTQRVAELARDGRPVGEVPATAVLVRPDGYVAWASSQARPGPAELRELRGALTRWFGI